MRSTGAWFGRLATVIVCLSLAGCGGGSDVPDPDSDSRAATNEPTKPTRRPAAAEPEAPEPVAVASNDAPKAETPEPEKPAPSTPPKDSSGTDEMLKPSTPPANAQAPSPAPTPAPAPTPTPTPSSPGAATPAPAPQATPPGGNAGTPAPQATPTTPGDNPTPTPGRGGGTAAPQGMQIQPANPPGGGPRTPGRAEGRPGGAGTQGFGLADESGMGVAGAPGGGPGGQAGATNFHTPMGAVTAFLAALKSKDKEKLTEATAKRAATEAEEKHKKIFTEIIEGSISDEDLDDIAKSFAGFQVMYTLNAKSTGRIGVVIGKTTTGGGHLQRTVIARKEKDGWKVLDIEDLYNFKPMMQFGRGKAKPKGR